MSHTTNKAVCGLANQVFLHCVKERLDYEEIIILAEMVIRRMQMLQRNAFKIAEAAREVPGASRQGGSQRGGSDV